MHVYRDEAKRLIVDLSEQDDPKEFVDSVFHESQVLEILASNVDPSTYVVSSEDGDLFGAFDANTKEMWIGGKMAEMNGEPLVLINFTEDDIETYRSPAQETQMEIMPVTDFIRHRHRLNRELIAAVYVLQGLYIHSSSTKH